MLASSLPTGTCSKLYPGGYYSTRRIPGRVYWDLCPPRPPWVVTHSRHRL